MEKRTEYTFDDFVEIVRELRKKCPWDSVQTHASLRSCLENESREVLEGISLFEKTGDGENLCEELGDLLLQIVLHSIIAQEEGIFTLEDVISGISEKMKFRHPKIFRPEDKEAATMSWDELKREEHILRKKLANKDRNAENKQKNLDNTGQKVYI